VCSLFLNPGEKIICPNKRWGNYDNIIVKNIGAQIESFEFFHNKKINLDGLRSAIKELDKIQDKIIIILNFPNNPTGYVPTKQEAQNLINLLQQLQLETKKPFIILVDDAYEPYIYNFQEDILDISIFYQLQQLEEDIIPIKLDGITKELLFYGGRIGFVTIGLKPSWIQDENQSSVLKDELNNKLEGFNRSSISNANHFYQTVAIKLFQEVGIKQIIESRNKVKMLLEKRCEEINKELMKINSPDISIDPNSGGFFTFMNLNPDKIKASEFADYLLTQHKVGVIPMENPRENINGIRIAYSSINLDQIPEFIERIKKALSHF
jgi:aspartate/methionine/tyrosine aminotransferase